MHQWVTNFYSHFTQTYFELYNGQFTTMDMLQPWLLVELPNKYISFPAGTRKKDVREEGLEKLGDELWRGKWRSSHFPCREKDMVMMINDDDKT